MMNLRTVLFAGAIASLVGGPKGPPYEDSAQRPPIGNGIRQFVKVDAPVVALTHARVIDGTGAPALADQTILIRDGAIAAVGSAASVTVPADATTIDLSGK